MLFSEISSQSLTFYFKRKIEEPNVRMSKEGFDYNDFFKGVVSALVVVGGVFEQ